jgi:hypothetical protein
LGVFFSRQYITILSALQPGTDAKYKVFSQILNRRFLSRNNFGIILCLEDGQKIDHKKWLITSMAGTWYLRLVTMKNETFIIAIP